MNCIPGASLSAANCNTVVIYDFLKVRWLSVLLLTTFLLLLIVELSLGGVTSLRSNPMIGPPVATLIQLGAKSAFLIVESHEIWRLFSACFLHAGLVHFLFNIVSYISLAAFLEYKLGGVLFGTVFIVSGMVGMLLSCVCAGGAITVGASGGLLGLQGACIAELLIHSHPSRPFYQPLLSHVISLIMIILVGVFVPFIDNYAHLGGFITGSVLACILFSASLSNRIKNCAETTRDQIPTARTVHDNGERYQVGTQTTGGCICGDRATKFGKSLASSSRAIIITSAALVLAGMVAGLFYALFSSTPK